LSYQIDADYSKVFLLPPSLEEFIPSDDPARFIRSFVDSLNLPELGFKVSSGIDGRPSFSTSLLLKVWLYGRYEEICSCRKLERRCKRDLALIWLTGMNYPDHNTLWRFFSRHKEAIKNLFIKSVKVAIENDLVGMVYHAIDGTKIAANVSRAKAISKKDAEKVLTKLDEYMDSLQQRISQHGAEEPPKGLPEELQHTQTLKQRIAETLEQLPNDSSIISTVDPECRMMRMKNGTFELGYNAQAVADDKTGIVVGAELTNQQNDSAQLVPMIEEVKQNTGSVAQQIVADGGYNSSKGLKETEQQNVYVNFPERSESSMYQLENFKFDPAKNVFVCPQGTQLYKKKKSRTEWLVYKCPERSFRSCPNRKFCTKSTKRKELMVHQHHQASNNARKRYASPEGKAALKKRKRVIEPVFAYIKEHMRFRKFRGYGMESARAVWFLICTIYNLKKIRTAKIPVLSNP
jgi:transposase